MVEEKVQNVEMNEKLQQLLEKAKKDVEILSAQAIEDLNKLPGNNEFLENLIRILIKRQK